MQCRFEPLTTRQTTKSLCIYSLHQAIICVQLVSSLSFFWQTSPHPVSSISLIFPKTCQVCVYPTGHFEIFCPDRYLAFCRITGGPGGSCVKGVSHVELSLTSALWGFTRSEKSMVTGFVRTICSVHYGKVLASRAVNRYLWAPKVTSTSTSQLQPYFLLTVDSCFRFVDLQHPLIAL